MLEPRPKFEIFVYSPRELTTVVLQSEPNAWMENNATRLKRCQEVLAEIYTVEKPYLAMLSVGLREIRNLL